jgi:phage/conjugal plasmid C-4 type zinc finger TraR family protein
MSDIVDDATELEQRQRDAALAARPKSPPIALRHVTDECIMCGEPIPPERRAAVPDCCRCSGCQSAYEGGGPRRC